MLSICHTCMCVYSDAIMADTKVVAVKLDLRLAKVRKKEKYDMKSFLLFEYHWETAKKK